MNMRTRFMKLSVGLMLCAVMLGSAMPTLAQWQRTTQWRNPWGYRSYSRYTVDRLISRAENRSDQFVRLFDRALDDSRLEGTIREDRLNMRAAELERELNIVRQQFNSTRNHYLIRQHVANAISAGQRINMVMNRRRLDPRAERLWQLLRYDLNQLARVYNVRQIA